MYPGTYDPSKPAVILVPSGATRTYGELEARSRQLAQLLHARGLRRGDRVAVFVENRLEFFDVLWAAMRSGLYLTTVNRYLTAEEAGYIVDDCGAQALVASADLPGAREGLLARLPRCPTRLTVGGELDGYEDFEHALTAHPADRLDEELAGTFMLYSSGTTGRPKGVRPPLPTEPVDEHTSAVVGVVRRVFGFDDTVRYLSPAPLYHAAPAGFTHAVTSLGGTAIVLEKFDPSLALDTIDALGVTHSQWVPTMFVRMLKLDPEQRARYDLSTHRMAIHAAAPCPPTVKVRMLEWWGPIIHEYYGGSEGIGLTYVGPEDWLSHRGTVGRSALGTIHICDEAGDEVPPGTDGIVYFEREQQVFEYHGDPEKTRAAHHPRQPTWAALGDIGHVDEDGFLYLTDRATFMIVAGGVNIYPQEIENVLIDHPAVADVAVIGVPNSDLGEEVKAVVELVPGAAATDDLVDELLAFSSARLARFKVPRSVDFVDELPRLPTGKLYKRLLRDRYWGDATSRII